MADDIHTLAGPYVLGALATDAERAAFEAHLARCDLCAEEVGDLLATSAVLGRAMAQPPPAGLRGRVLDEIARTPQERPGKPAKGGRRRPRPATLLAAACLVVATAAGGIAVREQRRLDHETTRTQAIAAVLSAPDARTVTGPAAAGGTLTAVASATRHSAVVTASGLPPLPSTKTYELWALGRAGALPAGLVRPDSGPLVAPVPAGYDSIGLTVEPAGGSPRPTMTPLALLNIRRA